MKTIELQCSLVEPKAEDGRSAIFTCPTAEGFGHVVSAALAFKAASSCSRVLSRASSGGYATARGMQIALSRASNGFARALGSVHFLVSGAAYDLAISLVKSAFVSGVYAFISGSAAFEW